AVGGAQAGRGIAHLVIVHDGIVDLDLQAEDWRREAADRRQQRIGRTRSRCAVTNATRALTRSCCALSTSRVVRWPTRASSRTPLRATSAAVTWAWVALICALAASSCPQAWAIADCTWSRAVSRSIRRCPRVSLDCRIAAYSAPP